ncbi:cleavage and polyadenylation specificity factor subunit 3, partial [Trichinella spiralis]|uniref:cleavage and polyadenylation specificity factor subunit 3 n=1 Tax=Trichinella spiralis TaxID=6334 RepID=UPI0001EFBA13
MPSAARLLLYSYVQRNVNVQDNTTQYLESVVRLLLCSCFYRDQSCVSTVPLSGFLHRHRIGLHHQHRARSYSCVGLGWLNGVTQYWSRNLCGFAYHRSTSICTGFRIHHTSLVVRVAISAFVNSLKCKSK